MQIGDHVTATLRLFILVSLLLASACGGTTGSQPPIAEASNFPMLRQDQADQLAEFRDLTFTPLSVVPANGSAKYVGFLEVNYASEEQPSAGLIGLLDVDIGFRRENLNVSGRVANIFSSEGDPLNGQLSITSGNIDRQTNPTIDHTVSFGIEGTLEDSASIESTYLVQLEGDFFGTSSSHLGGIALGRVETASVVTAITGRFTAERD